MKALLTLTGIMLMVVLSGCEEKEPCEKPYSCPEVEYFDCMPPASAEECYGECHDWIVANCPDVDFAW